MGNIVNHHNVLVLGATGFIGRRLVGALLEKGVPVRLFVRNKNKVPKAFVSNEHVDIVVGDLSARQGLEKALEGVQTAYYLVHSMGGKSLHRGNQFINQDRDIAKYFIDTANASALKHIIYLGGLGTGKDLSKHLSSRAEVSTILSSGKPSATTLRAAVIIGAGGASYEMLRYLVERLPIMVCPKWINTRIQPIAVGDVIQYLVGCLENPGTFNRSFDIGGPDILTYEQMMQAYAKARNLMKRFIVTLPVLSLRLSSYWVDLVTPIPSGVAHPLIEGMKNEVICQDTEIDTLIPIKKTPFEDAVKIAFDEEQDGPGKSFS